MGPVRLKRNNSHLLPSCICFLYITSLLVNIVTAQSYRKIKRQSDSSIKLAIITKPLDKVENTRSSDYSEFSFGDNVSGDINRGKHRRAVRKRRKKVPSLPSSTTRMPSVITSVTLLPKFGETQLATALPKYRSPPPRKRGHHSQRNKVPGVWKASNSNLDNVLALQENKEQIKPSILDKRESSEKNSYNHTSNFTSLIRDDSKDLMHSDESINPYLNTSTPISNELQNSLQFTLQILHPLLNSDTVLSEPSSKVPENKTVALTHSLSESVAQTPITPDIGFLPTHLKKKHPLLNQESTFSGGNEASKTGVRTNNDIQLLINHTTTSTSTPKPVTSTTTTSTTTTTEKTIPTIRTTRPSTTKLTTTRLTATTTTTSKPTTKRLMTTTKTPNLPPNNVLGMLNITEVKSDSKVNQVALEQSPIIITEKVPTTTTIKSVSRPTEDTISESAAEKFLVNTLLGLGNKEATNHHQGVSSPSQEDSSGEQQLLQLLSTLAQGQGSQSNSNSQPKDVSNLLLQTLLGSALQPQNGKTNAKQQQDDLTRQLLDLESLIGSLSSSGEKPTTSATTPTTTTIRTSTTSPSKGHDSSGLSDADLKSIFDLLDSQVTPSPTTPSTTTSSTTTPTTITTTTTTTTTTSRPTIPITSAPGSTTTTLHPALQSMLDLFTNQLKPFQNIPSSPSTFLRGLGNPTTPTPTLPPPTTTKAPTLFSSTTLNSLDLLSQLLNLGGGGANKINPVRSTPLPEFSLASLFGGGGQQPQASKLPQTPTPQFSLASIFGKNANTNNIFPSSAYPNISPPSVKAQPVVVHEPLTTPSESNQLLNFFGAQPPQPPATQKPSGLYYWFDLNAFLGGDPKADGMAGIRPKIGNRFPFIKIGS